jgi:hypothetical protein
MEMINWIWLRKELVFSREMACLFKTSRNCQMFAAVTHLIEGQSFDVNSGGVPSLLSDYMKTSNNSSRRACSWKQWQETKPRAVDAVIWKQGVLKLERFKIKL